MHALLLPVTLVWRWTGTRLLAMVDFSTRDCHRQRGIGMSAAHTWPAHRRPAATPIVDAGYPRC